MDDKPKDIGIHNKPKEKPKEETEEAGNESLKIHQIETVGSEAEMPKK